MLNLTFYGPPMGLDTLQSRGGEVWWLLLQKKEKKYHEMWLDGSKPSLIPLCSSILDTVDSQPNHLLGSENWQRNPKQPEVLRMQQICGQIGDIVSISLSEQKWQRNPKQPEVLQMQQTCGQIGDIVSISIILQKGNSDFKKRWSSLCETAGGLRYNDREIQFESLGPHKWTLQWTLTVC